MSWDAGVRGLQEQIQKLREDLETEKKRAEARENVLQTQLDTAKGEISILRADIKKLTEEHEKPPPPTQHADIDLGKMSMPEIKTAMTAANVRGWKPLHTAAFQGDCDRVRWLIDSGADVNDRDSWGNTPLHRAAQGGRADAVKVLLRAGAIPDARNKGGWTPMHWAATEGKPEAIPKLVEGGAGVEDKDRVGRTPMSLAVQKGHDEVVAVLKENGATA